MNVMPFGRLAPHNPTAQQLDRFGPSFQSNDKSGGLNQLVK